MELKWTTMTGGGALAGPGVSRWQQLASMVRGEGIGAVAGHLWHRFRANVHSQHAALILERTLAGPLATPKANGRLEVRQMVEKDLELLRQAGAALRERRIRDFAARMAGGRIGVIAMLDGQPVGYGWLSRLAEVESFCGIKICLSPREGYIYDGFVLPAHRRSGIYPYLLNWRLDYLRNHGCQIVYSIVDPGNAPALRCHRSLGFRVKEELKRTKFLSFERRLRLPPAQPADGGFATPPRAVTHSVGSVRA